MNRWTNSIQEHDRHARDATATVAPFTSRMATTRANAPQLAERVRPIHSERSKGKLSRRNTEISVFLESYIFLLL
jgi:hypothetical protein